jgi:hypothetical protein
MIHAMNQTTARAVSQSQISTYLRECKRKGVAPENISGWTYDKMYARLGELFTMGNLATQPQMELIMSIRERFMQIMPQHIHEEIFAKYGALHKLTFDQAREVIDELRQIETRVREWLPASENQVKRIVEMYLCPDVDFTYIGIELYIDLGEQEIRTRTPHSFLPNGEPSKWNDHVEVHRVKRRMTVEELTARVANISAQDATDFIRRFDDEYKEWRRTRIRPSQIEFIRSLEKQMSVFDKPKVVSFEPVQNGDAPDIASIIMNHNRQNREVESFTYEPIAYELLIQFTPEQADEYIDQIRNERFKPERFQRAGDDVNPQVDMRDSQNERNFMSREWNVANNIMHTVLSATGREDVDLLMHLTEIFTAGGRRENIVESRTYIRDFFLDVIRGGAITVGTLFMMLEKSDEMTEILVGL